MAENSSAPADQNANDKGAKLLAKREETALISKLTLGFGSIITLIVLAWAIELPLRVGFQWFDEQAMATCLGFTLAVIFIRYPLDGGNKRMSLPWYDVVLALLGLGTCLYLVYIYGDVETNPFAMRPTMFTIGIILIPLVWEALRRTTGWSLTIVFSVFMAYAFVGHLMPGMLEGREQKYLPLIAELGVTNVALLGLPMKIIVLTVVLFIWMGQLLLHTGASEWFTDLAAAIMGRSRGGSAKIAVVASGLFGSISGSAVSNVASTGVITIPLMRQAGYDAKTAGAIESVASTGGQIMPPIMGAAAFLMAELLELEYTEIILAALIPSALYYLAVFVQADLEAAKNGIAPLPKDRIPPLMRVLKEGWFFVLPYVALIYTLFSLNLPPQESAFWAAISVAIVSIVFGYKGHRVTPAQIWESVAGGGRASAEIIVIGAMAGIIIAILDRTGLGQALTLILASVGEDSLFLLLILTALVSILLGMGMPTSAIYLLLATMIAPSLIKLGVHPIAAHMFVLYFGLMSMITPPVAIAAFAAASLSGAKPMETGMTAVRLGWIAYVIPFVFVLSPSLLWQGDASHILMAAVTAFMGVWIASCGVIGYMFGPLSVFARLIFFVAGILLLLPADALPHGLAINGVGLVLGILMLSKDYFTNRRGKAAQPAPGGGGE
ncbi:MAG: TRAP transporter permease [Alphaproteobacteria bacterium]